MSTHHSHEGFPVAPETTPVGPLDAELLSKFIAAGFDGCMMCQERLLSHLANDPATTGRLVELACVAVSGELGGLPASLTVPDAPGPASAEFRRLAAAGLDGEREAMFTAAETLTPAERASAVATAADLLVGLLSR